MVCRSGWRFRQTHFDFDAGINEIVLGRWSVPIATLKRSVIRFKEHPNIYLDIGIFF
jgi:hypothetical protein